MEKLIELLNEYETPRSWVVYKSYDDYDWFFYWVDIDGETEIAWSDSLICSKKFWWIEWLVENDKIDFEEYADEWRDSNINNNADFFQLYKHYDMYECVLMILAISDEPIEFLISILK